MTKKKDFERVGEEYNYRNATHPTTWKFVRKVKKFERKLLPFLDAALNPLLEHAGYCFLPFKYIHFIIGMGR